MDFDFLQTTVLALIQGLTEFLPVSSSAHLILPSVLLGWEDQGLAFDVAVHLGSLLAVILYFRRDLVRMLVSWTRSLLGGGRDADSHLAWMLIIATLPVIVAGFVAKDLVEDNLRNAGVIAITTILFGVFLWWGDLRSKNATDMRHMSWKTALLIGLAQILALIPGVSRSGITTTAGLFCNLGREESSRFSFLLSIPVIGGAALLLSADLLQAQDVPWVGILYGMALTALVAFACIHYFLKAIAAIGFLPFFIYRIALGGMLLLFFV